MAIPEMVRTKYHDTEISKAEDFEHTALSPLATATALLAAAFADVANSFVISGMTVSQLVTPSMNVAIAPGVGFSRASDKIVHLAAALNVPVTGAHATLGRIDTLEVRYIETLIDQKSRAFKNQTSGVITYSTVATKSVISIEARCLAGTPGAGAAPVVEAGWMKLAEVVVPAGSTAIFNANIRNITAQEDATSNTAWTTERQVTFYIGTMESIKGSILAHVAASVTGAVSVHGIRQGHGNGFDSDYLDGKHGSEYALRSNTAQTINVANSLPQDISAMAIGEYKTVTKTGAGNGPVRLPTGNMFLFTSATGSGVATGGATVYANAAEAILYVLRVG